MPIKIKSTLRYQKALTQQSAPAPDTPIRNTMSRQSAEGSGLKKLSDQRNLKKLSKQKDASIDSITNKQLLQSLTNLSQQYEQMRNLTTTSNRRSAKQSLGNIKGVPHTTITLKPRASVARQSSQSNLSFHSAHSQSNSFSLTEGSFKVISIGTLLGQPKKHKSKRINNSEKGIHISLLSTMKRKSRLI